MDAKIMKEIHDIRVMLEDIQDDIKYFKNFMQEKQISGVKHVEPEVLETGETSEAERENVESSVKKNKKNELSVKI